MDKNINKILIVLKDGRTVEVIPSLKFAEALGISNDTLRAYMIRKNRNYRCWKISGIRFYAVKDLDNNKNSDLLDDDELL